MNLIVTLCGGPCLISLISPFAMEFTLKKKKKIMETFFAGWNVSQILYSVKHTLDDNEKGFQYGYESSRIVR